MAGGADPDILTDDDSKDEDGLQAVGIRDNKFFREWISSARHWTLRLIEWQNAHRHIKL
jgi:hypothetical protein